MAMSDFLMAMASGYIVAAIISALAFFMVYALLDEPNCKHCSKLVAACIAIAAGVVWLIAWAVAVKSTFKRYRNET